MGIYIRAILKGSIIATLFLSDIALPDVLILTPPSERAIKIAEKIQQKVVGEKVVVSSSLSKSHEYSLVVTLGSSILDQYANEIKSPHIATFISPHEYKKLEMAVFTESSAVFSAASPKKFLEFISETFGKVSIGYVYTDKDDIYLSELERIVADDNIRIVATPLLDQDIFKTYRHLFEDNIDVMLVTSNPDIYTSRNIRYVLEMLFRQKVPAVTFSKSLLNAGAAASLYSPEYLIVDRTASAINNYLKTETLHVASYADSPIIGIDEKMLKLFAFDSNAISRRFK